MKKHHKKHSKIASLKKKAMGLVHALKKLGKR